MKGNICAKRVLVSGLIEGECAANGIEILSNGTVKGIIYSSDLSIEKGGHFVGETKESEGTQVITPIEEAKKQPPKKQPGEQAKTSGA